MQRSNSDLLLFPCRDRDDIQDVVFLQRTCTAPWWSAHFAQRLMQYFGASRPTALPQLFPDLTEREREILALIAQGYTNSAIAEKLVLSPKTVRNHVSNIFSKLQVAGRSEAIIRARDAGLT